MNADMECLVNNEPLEGKLSYYKHKCISMRRELELHEERLLKLRRDIHSLEKKRRARCPRVCDICDLSYLFCVRL